MTIWLVTRHAGALKWFERQGLPIDRTTPHLELDTLQAGDTVIGTLPVHLVAQLTERQVRYIHLAMQLPEALRGKELTAADMDACGARLEAFTAFSAGVWN